MKNVKIYNIVFLLVILISSVLCQEADNNVYFDRYPNELKGYELMKTSKIKTLVPGISTQKDVLEVFGKECKNPHARLKVCELDKNWYVSFTYDGETNSGILWSIIFYPSKRLPFSKINFSRAFEHYEMGIAHLPIEVTKFTIHSDKFGMSYVTIDENSDIEFRKGDLFSIEYGLPYEDRKE